jgi:hypothetical protein
MSFNQTKKDLPWHWKPVRITNFNLEHSCDPGLAEARLAKKAAGTVFGQLDISQIKDAIELVVKGNMKSHQVRTLLCKHILEGYEITSDAMRNFRECALKCYLEEKLLDKSLAHKLIKFQPLDASKIFLLPDTDLCHKKVRYLMQQVMQGKDGGWKAKDFLESKKKCCPGFDYRIMLDEKDGSPVAILWMTPTMWKSWIWYGKVMFIDMMKQNMNHLHWPYMSLVGLDHEKRVSHFGECLCLEEELEYYGWSIKELESMEPRRSETSICIIFANGVMADTLLDLVGVQHPQEIGVFDSTDGITDSFHLLSTIWPHEFGQQLFDRLREDLNALVYGDMQEAYESAYSNVVSKIGSNPTMLEYLKGYYDHPERFARYYIKRIPCNLGKTSSQPAEANHSSVIAHLGPGSQKDMVIQIKDLLARQAEIDMSHRNTDARYKLVSAQLAHEAEKRNKPEEAKALQMLSSFGYNDYWNQSSPRSG